MQTAKNDFGNDLLVIYQRFMEDCFKETSFASEETFSLSVIGLISGQRTLYIVKVSLSYGIGSFKIVCGKQKGSYFLLLRLENKNLDFEQIKTEIYY